MSYQILEIETTEPLPVISAAAPDSVIAPLVRYQQRPLAFWMEPLQRGQMLSEAAMAQRISEKVATRLLRAKLREQLMAGLPAAPLPSLTVAVCAKGPPDQLVRCLKSIETACSAMQRASGIEILLIDSAPSDGRSHQPVNSRMPIRHIRESRPGLGFARNRALHEAKSVLLAFLDQAAVMDSGWLAGLEEAWTENPDAAAFTGLVLPYELTTAAQISFEKAGGLRIGSDAEFDKIRFGRNREGDWRYPRETGVLGSGANMIFRRQVLLELGGFDEALDLESLVSGSGDLDLFNRLLRAGHPMVYEPRCLVFRQHESDFQALHRQYWNRGLHYLSFVSKLYEVETGERPKLRRLILWWFKRQAEQLLASIRGRSDPPPGCVLRQLLGGLKGLCGEYARSSKRIAMLRTRCE